MPVPPRITWLVIVGLVLTCILPVAAAILLAHRQAADAGDEYVLAQARTALTRAEMTGDQLYRVVSEMGQLTSAEACSLPKLEQMRRLHLDSYLLKGIGWMDGDTMVCSTLGGARQVRLGPPHLVNATGSSFWIDIPLFEGGTRHVVFQAGQAAGILHRELALSYVEDVPGSGVAVFSLSKRLPLVQRGRTISPALLSADLPATRVIRTPDAIIGIVRSSRFDIAAAAMIPRLHFAGVAYRWAWILVGLGAAAAMALSVLFLRLVRGRFSMRSMIRAGLDAKRFGLVYQPVMDLETRHVVGVEALLRWDRSKQIAIPPDVFIPVAEEAGLIRRLTRRVFDILAVEAPAIAAVAPHCAFAVNLSPTDMLDERLPGELATWSERSGMSLNCLIIEATERALLDLDQSAERFRWLRQQGLRIAIDDFGTGYSSLAYLVKLDIDCLKIDKLFIHALGTSAATNEVASAIVRVAQQLGVRTVAEGIETEAQAEQVRKMGVDMGQGYFYARPMPLPQLLTWLQSHQAEDAAGA